MTRSHGIRGRLRFLTLFISVMALGAPATAGGAAAPEVWSGRWAVTYPIRDMTTCCLELIEVTEQQFFSTLPTWAYDGANADDPFDSCSGPFYEGTYGGFSLPPTEDEDIRDTGGVGQVRACASGGGGDLILRYIDDTGKYGYGATRGSLGLRHPDLGPQEFSGRVTYDSGVTTQTIDGLCLSGNCNEALEQQACAGVEATISSPDPDGIFRGGSGRDVIVGTQGPDEIHAGAGNDLVCGLSGNDRILGEAGEDTLLGGGGSDVVLGGSGNDRLEGGDGADLLRGEDGSDLILGQGGRDGDSSFESPKAGLFGGLGNDLLMGGGNDDWLFGGDDWEGFEVGDDVLVDHEFAITAPEFGPAGTGPVVPGTEADGDDVLYGGNGDDRFLEFEGDDSLSGEGGRDLFFSTDAGDDTIAGGRGPWFDTISYRFATVGVEVALASGFGEFKGSAFSGRDRLFDINFIEGSPFGDRLIGGGDETYIILGEGGRDRIAGGSAPDQLEGGRGPDRLTGQAGNDVLFGEGGKDFLNGGKGEDRGDGGPGRDTCRSVERPRRCERTQ